MQRPGRRVVALLVGHEPQRVEGHGNAGFVPQLLPEREAFLAREAARYRLQLRRYVTLMRAFGNRPVKAGLYFPLLGSFHEVDVDRE